MPAEKTIPFSIYYRKKKTMDLTTKQKKEVMRYADDLPKEQQKEFWKQFKPYYTYLTEICKDHPRTIGFSVLGLIAGELVDGLLTVSVPFYEEVCLTGDIGSSIGGCVGAVIGYVQDRERIADRDQKYRTVEAVQKHFFESSNIKIGEQVNDTSK